MACYRVFEDNRAMSSARLFLVLLAAVGAGLAQTSADNSIPVPLNLKRVVELALAPDGNVRAQLARESERMAQAQAGQVRAALLPTLSGRLNEQNQTVNLSAFGVQLHIPVPGFAMPVAVGPFNTFDARISAEQAIFDLSAIRRSQAAQVATESAKSQNQSTRDAVATQAAKNYFAALRADALLETEKANLSLAEALVKAANDRLSTEKGIAIEVTRARSHLASQKQRLLAAENDRLRAYLQLLREIGLPIDSQIQLTDSLSLVSVPETNIQEAIKTAL